MNIEQYEVIKVIKTYQDYEVRLILAPASESGNNEPYETQQAFTLAGNWIGSQLLIDPLGVKPEKRLSKHSTWNIGFSEKHQRWYGWSLNALKSFEIGYVVEDWLAKHSEDDLDMPAGFQAKTLEDCKQLATLYAQVYCAYMRSQPSSLINS